MINLSNPYTGFDKYIYENDIEDFKMPYSNFGQYDKKVMLERYRYLSNSPANYLHVRKGKMLEDYKW
jgi:hypothetical protein